MKFFESFRIAWTALRTNKLRSLLTMLGIIIGVGAVIAMLAIGNGFRSFLNQQFSTFGVGVFYIGPFVDSRKLDEATSAQLTAADAEAILQPGVAPAVKNVSVEYGGSATVSTPLHRGNYSVRGVTPSHFEISTNELGPGRYFYDLENRERARVAVIGAALAEKLFGDADTALGQRFSVNGVGFDVVGILETKSSGGGPFDDPQQSIFVPYETAKSRLFRNQLSARVDVNTVTVQAVDADSVPAAVQQVTQLLRERHRLTYQNNDFSIIDLGQILATVDGIINGFNMFLVTIGAISLLVGGIGIMNIMLVSVTERTREIGLRKAVGARQWDILQQFLVEAVVLCLIGGALGIALGFGLSTLGTLVLVNVFQAEGAVASVTPGAVLLATGISAAIGIAFGFFPALQAARLNPIEALRYE